MSNFHTATKVPAWRLLLYGFTGLAIAGWLDRQFDNRGLIIGAAVGIPVLMVLILAIFRFGRSPLAQRHRGAILWLYLLSQAALIIWSIIERAHHS